MKFYFKKINILPFKFNFILTFKSNFILFFIFIFIFAFAFTFPIKTDTQVWNTDLSSSLIKAKKINKPLLLDFFATWCGFCRKMREEIYPSKLVSEITNNFVLVRINGEVNPNLMKKFGVSSYPTVILLNQNGEPLDTIIGLISEFELSKRLINFLENSKKNDLINSKLNLTSKDLNTLYDGGAFFFEKKNYKNAENLFFKAWLLNKNLKKENSNYIKVRQSLYNSNISCMHQEKYNIAAKRWDLYIAKYGVTHREYKYARYYRGISNFFLGNKSKARLDLIFASEYLPDENLRANAKSYLQIN